MLPSPMIGVWVLQACLSVKRYIKIEKKKIKSWGKGTGIWDESPFPGKGLRPFQWTEPDVPRGPCLLTSWVAFFSVRGTRRKLSCSLMGWSHAGPNRSLVVWFRLGLEKGYSTLPAFAKFLVPWICTTLLLTVSFLRVSLPPSSILASREKTLEPRACRLRANILLLFD